MYRPDRGTAARAGELHHDLVKHADAYVGMGFTRFTLGVNGPDFEVGAAVREWLDWRGAANG